jgi:F-type H+-transporting ATPase subunit epsilon
VSQGPDPSLHLEVFAPRGPVFEGDVLQVILPAVTGEMGVLSGHAPLVAQLAIGRMRAQLPDGRWLEFAVADGFVKVQAESVVVLADSAQEASEIDIDLVKQAMERATQRLEMYHAGTVPEGEDVDPYREQLAFKRAQNRLRVAGRLDE